MTDEWKGWVVDPSAWSRSWSELNGDEQMNTRVGHLGVALRQTNGRWCLYGGRNDVRATSAEEREMILSVLRPEERKNFVHEAADEKGDDWAPLWIRRPS